MRNQILFTQYLGDSQKIHEGYFLKESYNFHAPYMLPIYLESNKKAIDLISQGIPIIKWPLLPKSQVNSKNIKGKFEKLYFVMLNYPLNRKRLMKN